MTRRKVVITGAAASVAASFSATRAQAGTPRNHVIEIAGFAFVPDDLKVRVGDTVTWINHDIVPHTATALDDTWNTETLERDQSQQVIIVAGLSEAYFCEHHPAMTGRLRILTD